MHKWQLIRLASNIGVQFYELRREDWRTDSGPDERRGVRLVGPGQIALNLTCDDRTGGQLHVTGLFPDGTWGYKSWTANMNPAKPPRVLAREIERRVIAAGYVDDLLVAVERKRAADKRAAARLAWLAKAAALFGLAAPSGLERVYLDTFLDGTGYVQSYRGQHDDRLTLDLSGIPAEVALRMLQVLAESVQGAGPAQAARGGA